jgi:transketolase
MNDRTAGIQIDIDTLCINTIRGLSMDAVQQANSGHPGAPMGLAPAAYTLWTRHLRHHPENPAWPNRDRFVLSGGHASMLLYSLLYLTGYDLSLDDIRQFRQWGSKTPGHPEYGHTPGVETTTGPLGQGFATAVGMAMAERHLAAKFNRDGHEIVDHFTYVICGDGDLMEGLSAEAASLAGHLGLGRLICLYDSNRISIEGSTDITFTEDVGLRFQAYGWQVLAVEDGNDVTAIDNAVAAAKAETGKPSLVIVRTQIAYGSPNKQGSADAHGAPLGVDEIRLTKLFLGCPENECFCSSDPVLAHCRKAVAAGAAQEADWRERVNDYEKHYPELARQWADMVAGTLPEGWEKTLPAFAAGDGSMATRKASGIALNALAETIPGLVGGSADLAPSNNTVIKSTTDFQKTDYSGRNIRFGVREHAMAAILNGLSLHTPGLKPYGGTFLVFADYMRPAIRLSALMKQPVIYIFTHDSIAVGEDGPTHQPVEHLASLRAIPGLAVIRPADATETAAAWQYAVTSQQEPVALILSRQNLPVIDRSSGPGADHLRKGGYVLLDTDGAADVILIGTGSEVHLCVAARKMLKEKGISARVVSMPSWELFEKMPKDYKESVLPANVRTRVAVEAGIPMGWEKYVGDAGAIVGMTTFGASAPGGMVMKNFGFTAENVAETAQGLIRSQAG